MKFQKFTQFTGDYIRDWRLMTAEDSLLSEYDDFIYTYKFQSSETVCRRGIISACEVKFTRARLAALCVVSNAYQNLVREAKTGIKDAVPSRRVSSYLVV